MGFYPTPPTEPYQFRLGPWRISALGRRVSWDHPHVRLLAIRRGLFSRCMHWLLSRLPLRPRLLRALPAPWVLPTNIVLKEIKPDRADEYNHEKEMYARLEPLQGTIVPVYYGEARCDDGTPALVVSDVGGVSLDENSSLFNLKVQRVREMLRKSFTAVFSFGVVHTDANFGNYQVVDDRIVILDLESVESIPDITIEWVMDIAVEGLVDDFIRQRISRKDWWERVEKIPVVLPSE